jgi:hypothetical protein
MQRLEIIQYVADTAEQMAQIVRDILPLVALLLETAAELARDAIQKIR